MRTRTRAAIWTAAAASGASRLLRRGSGDVIGGRLALLIAPGALTELAAGRCLACVSGTNGKTTTTRLLVQALRTREPVKSNAGGANMTAGHVTALARPPRGAASVLEVDEVFLPRTVAAVSPRVILLLNLSRDQLDRVAEIRRIVAAWRGMVEAAASGADGASPAPVVVANADDPLVFWAAAAAGSVVWIAAGTTWHSDAALCPSCGAPLDYSATSWHCTGCELCRPPVQAGVEGEELVLRGERYPIRLSLPGRANRANAAMATAAAQLLGVPPGPALAAMRAVGDVDGRYGVHRGAGVAYRLLLAKNPAGWAELFELLRGSDRPLAIAINARTADGKDTSWLWDVPFEALAGRFVTATGERAADLALRLRYAGVEHELVQDLSEAVRAAAGRAARPAPDPTIDVAANYTAFRMLRGSP